MEPTDNTARTHVYPIQSFLEITRLLGKLNLTPADGLQLLAEVLGDLDRQIEEQETYLQADAPRWLL